MLRRSAVLPALVLALVVQTLALLGLAAAPASAATVPLGLEPGDLVISDTGHDRVIVVPADGGPDRVLATGLDGPGPVAVTPTGDVVVGETNTGDIQLVRADGTGTQQLNVGNYVQGISTLALDGEGNVLAGGNAFGGIGRVPLTGGPVENLFDSWPVPWYPALAVAPDGDIVARELPDSGGEYVVRLDPDGSNRTVISELSFSANASAPRNITAVAVTAAGRAIVADDWYDEVWESDGSSTATSFGSFDTPSALAVDGTTGAVYVADLFNNRVVVVSADRSSQTDVATDSALLHPSGVAVVPPLPTQVGDVFGAAGDTVYELNADNTSTVVASGLGTITGLAVTDDGDLVVSNAAGAVVEIAGDGSLARTTLGTGLLSPTAVAAGPDDAIYYGTATGQVWRMGSPTPVAQIGVGTPVTGLAVGPDGTPYYSNDSLVVGGADPDSRVMTTLDGAAGLAWDPARRLLAGVRMGIATIDPRETPPTFTPLTSLVGDSVLAVDEDGHIVAPDGVPVAGESSPGSFGVVHPGAGTTLTEIATYVPRPELTAAAPPATGNVGAEYDGYTFEATDPAGLGVDLTVYDGALPPGLVLDDATGELTGEPTTAGAFTFRVQAANPGRAIVSDPITVTVGKRLQTIAFDSTIPSPAYVGTTYEPSATGGGSTSAVTFAIDPASAGVCTYDSGTGEVTFTAAGACVVLADQAGDADHEAATQASETVYVTKRNQTVTFSTAAPTGAQAEVGDTYTPAATASSGLSPVTYDIHFSTPAGNCSISGGVVTFLQEGLCRVRARQSGDDAWWSASATQDVTIVEKADEPTSAPTSIAFTSAPPEPAVVGQQYAVVAATSPAGGVVELHATGGCSLTGATVTFEHAGPCRVEATSGAASATQSITVQKAATSLAVAVDRDVIVATVTVVAPGGGTPTGAVVFSDHGEEIGTGALFVDGAGDVVATLSGALATGEAHSVTATYAGSADHLGSSSVAVSRTDPTITAELTSRKPVSEAGWYRTPVTITFTCEVGTAPLVGGCLDPITLRKDRRGQRPLSFGIVAEDGGAAEVDVTVRIDKRKPTVKVRGVKRAVRTGDPGKLRCVARDALSGVDTCTIRTRIVGERVRYRAVALDLAGNRTVVRGRYSPS